MKANELTNLWVGYNRAEDFRVLVCASDPLETGSDESNKIANILYNMSLDMDYMDNIEHCETEINAIAREIDTLKEKDSVLFHVLNTLAYANEDSYDLLTRRRLE